MHAQFFFYVHLKKKVAVLANLSGQSPVDANCRAFSYKYIYIYNLQYLIL